MIPFPTGFFLSTLIFIIASVVAEDIKSKWGVSPFITQPRANTPSYLFMFLIIVTGISKTPRKIIIKEYLDASNFFLDDSQTKYLNALLDKISKKIRTVNE